jgi:intracellular multiplication protein IcmJ
MKKNKELRLTSHISSWLAPTLHGTASDTDPRMMEVRDKILLRDDYTCYYCNFKSQEHQEIHHFNHNHEDFNEKNLTTVCPLCHQVFHLSTCSQSTGGSIIVLKDISQVDLNNLCRMLFVARSSGVKEWVNVSKQIYDTLRSTITIIDQQISPNGSEPMIFAQTLHNLSETVLNEEHMKSFKLLPKYNRFEKQIEYWRDNVFKELPVEKWRSLIPTTIDVDEIERNLKLK